MTNDKGHLLPLSNYGIKCMSMGFLTDTDKAMVWRGPMVVLWFLFMLGYIGGERDVV